MLKCLIVFTIVLAGVAAAPRAFKNERIVGGELTTIDQYPFQSAVLQTWGWGFFEQICAGIVMNARSILTAAHCLTFGTTPDEFRMRVGSTYAHSGGVEHNVAQIILHSAYNPFSLDSDVAIVRTASIIVYNEFVQPAMIAGPSYNLADDEPVWAIGWGQTTFNGVLSEQLRHVQVYTVNQALCRTRYRELNNEVTNNMLCSGVIDEGGRDQCQGDSGGPLIHNGVVVGVSSWGEQCALARYPGVNTRVSRFTRWIQANA